MSEQQQDGGHRTSSLKTEIWKSAIALGIVLASIVGFAELTSHVNILAGLVWGFATIGALGAWSSYAGDSSD